MKNALVTLAVLIAAVVAFSGCGQPANAQAAARSAPVPAAEPSEPVVELAPSQLSAIEIASVGMHLFPLEKEAIGNIDFDGDRSVAVFPPYPGKILNTLAALGDGIKKGEPLYTIDSPDLLQAESNLLSAVAAFDRTSKELARVKNLSGADGGVSEKEFEQAVSDQVTAEGALKAARDAVRLFGKTEAEVDRIIASHTIDSALVVRSPIAGQITAKNAAPGLWVQPGAAPAPYAAADVTVKWLLANASESDSPLFHIGQPARVQVMAFPNRVFDGQISKIYAAVDPATHRATVRCDIRDPKDELRPGMFASFVIEIRKPTPAMALPANGVVREGDGTMTAWVTTDQRHFAQRIIQTGRQRDGWIEVRQGLQPGELAVSNGAIFLDNLLQASANN